MQSNRESLASAEKEFVLHDRHSLSALAAVAREYLPGIHESHTPLPIKALYFPRTHAVQVSVPEYPTLHTQSSGESLPVAEV